MKLNVLRFLTGILTLLGIVIGGKSVIMGLNLADAPTSLDNGYRFYAGTWFGVSLGLGYCIFHIQRCGLLYRGLLLTIFVGGIARIVGAFSYAQVEPNIIVPTLIELILPPLLVWLQKDFEATATPTPSAP